MEAMQGDATLDPCAHEREVGRRQRSRVPGSWVERHESGRWRSLDLRVKRG
jgi:hypothetical protein